MCVCVCVCARPSEKEKSKRTIVRGWLQSQQTRALIGLRERAFMVKCLLTKIKKLAEHKKNAFSRSLPLNIMFTSMLVQLMVKARWTLQSAICTVSDTISLIVVVGRQSLV